MKPTLQTPYSKWVRAFNTVYSALPDQVSLPCPNCGRSTLRLVFVGDPEDRIGYASFWCDSCHYGLRFSRIEIPEGVDMLPFNTSEQVILETIPDYEEVPYEDDEQQESDDNGSESEEG